MLETNIDLIFSSHKLPVIITFNKSTKHVVFSMIKDFGEENYKVDDILEGLDEQMTDSYI